MLDELLAHDPPQRAFWNVNLPHLTPDAPDPETVYCEPCRQPLPLRYAEKGDHYHYEGDYQQRPADRGGDVELCFGGKITISRVRL